MKYEDNCSVRFLEVKRNEAIWCGHSTHSQRQFTPSLGSCTQREFLNYQNKIPSIPRPKLNMKNLLLGVTNRVVIYTLETLIPRVSGLGINGLLRNIA